MHSHTGDEKCPVCGQNYATMVVLKQPVDWRDVYQGRPVDFFREHDRTCRSDYDAEADSHVSSRARAVYFHDESGPSGELI